MTLPFPLPAPGDGARLDLHVLRSVFGDGPFTTRQAERAGVGRRRLRALVLDGGVSSQVTGVHRVGADAVDSEDRARLVALVLPSGATAVRRTAAWIHGFDVRRPAASGLPLPVECVVGRDTPRVRRAGVRCFRADLGRDDVSCVAGVPCTTPTRTAADLFRFVDPPMALAAADAMARRRLLRADDVRQGLRGPALRSAGWIEPRSESFGESWLRLRVLDAGFPRPVAQVPIREPGGRVVYRIDLGWPHVRVGVEYDGEEYHSGAGHREADRRRRERLARDFGWQVVGVGRGEVLGPRLDLERGIGELLGRAPTIRRRRW